ncbi:MAG: hypothetical protein CSB49_03975 [Proteobacteria bacterium]|nr:MAG: hypothetical protein CSB49_03975 [Pseudomonadota bacterium]
MTDREGNSGRKNGRPAKGEPPRVPYEELDRILVFGEVVTCEDGESTTVHYPSYRDLARRYEVCNSVIARYSKKHNCLWRREQAKARIAVETDKKLVDLRSTAIAMSKDDELRIIDTYLAGFEMALADGRVRFDNPTDFNTMVRLKEFIQGGADSRQEIHAALSLEDIQARHRRMLKTVETSSTAERGELDDHMLAVPISGLQPQGSNPPSAASPTAAEEVTDDSALTGMVPRVDTAHSSPPVALCAADAEEWDQDAEPGDPARQGANVAPTARDEEGSGDERDDQQVDE